jgi:protein SERAC1
MPLARQIKTAREEETKYKGLGASPAKVEYGLHTLVPKDPRSLEAIDIVAIHGLNGHFERTWTDEATGFNWLRDAIPRSIPTARVLTFEYNSVLQFSKSTSDIFTFGDELLESLLVERRTPEERNRSLIFICHSLGGLVFKQVGFFGLQQWPAHDASRSF